MAFLTAQEFRDRNVTKSATEFSPDQIEDCLETAKDELILWCGEATVAGIEAATDTSLLKTRRFRKAQEKLAMRELLQKMSARFRSGGIQISEKDLSDSAVNTYEGYAATEARRKVLYVEAEALVESYLSVQSGGFEICFSPGKVDSGCCDA